MRLPLDTVRKVISAVFLVAMIVLVVGVPLDLDSQWLFAGLAVVGAMWFAAQNTRTSLLSLSILSLLVSSRYMFWRSTQTLEFDSFWAFFFGTGLYAAEIYAFVILVLGFLQTAWPLDRPAVKMNGDPSNWPTVDVFIPTYNESLEIVRNTVFAAMDLDYPPDRFRVYLLDDGRRSEFQSFAREAGCGYLTRADNKHAKAGNLNTAMRKTSGELVVVFDCDHVPTRSFLQMTIGWFQRESKLAILQTPHHFYSPDPVQRNLKTVSVQPGEGDLFYGPVQRGNDLWNSAFFCGSCAVIRREALREIGGFAGDTVTEDAHTALRIQRKGWSTAYLGIKLSAGLATERLALHIGQRIRWARGMTQILRVDNPLLGSGLNPFQRLCYLNAMLHFQFPLPRIVFLTSPLAYLLFGENIIHASASMIFAYAVPHLYCAMVSGTRMHGNDRRPFWSEIYETVLAFHLVPPTVVTLFNPRKGKFNVTDKGGRLDRSYFDARVVRPHLICAFLMILGIAVGGVKLAFYPTLFNIQADTYVLNAFWATFNLLILIAALSVARESRQAREHIRIPTALPVTIYFENGHLIDAISEEVSMGGLSATLPPELFVDTTDWRARAVSLPTGDDMVTLPVHHLRHRDGRISVRFADLSMLQNRLLVRAIMGRADTWERALDRPRVGALRSLLDILVIDAHAMGRMLHLNRRERRAERADMLEERQERLDASRDSDVEEAPPPRSARSPMRRFAAVGLAAALSLGMFLNAATASAQAPARTAVSAAPGNTSGGSTAADANLFPQTSPGRYAADGTARKTLTLKDLRVQRPIRLEGVRGEVGIPFGMRHDEVVTGATLTLTLAWSPAMLADLSQLVVLMNGEVIRVQQLATAQSAGVRLVIPVNPALFLPGDNMLNLRLLGHYARDCEDPFHSSLWANISNVRSKFDLTVQNLPFDPDLALLPRPFFDEFQNRGLFVPFVFAGQPGNGELEAAASIASWLGAEASYRGFDFFPVFGSLPKGNGIVFLRRGQSIPGLSLTPRGAAARIMRNPADSHGQLLIIMGRDDRELKLAAAAIASNRSAYQGQYAGLNSARIPNYPAHGAPRWLRTDRPVQLGELVDPNTLQGVGISPGALSVQFRSAPDLFFWPRDGGEADVRYRYPTGSWLDRRNSRLDVSLNGQFERSLPLGQANWWSAVLGNSRTESNDARGSVTLPRYNLYGQNEAVFDYHLVVVNKQRCEGTVPQNIRVSILPTSTLDLTDAYHALQMPHLASFASAGYPFTVRPDLAETVALIDRQPDPDAIRAFLMLMGRFGDSTGVATTRLQVIRKAQGANLNNKDVLVLGSSNLLRGSDLFDAAPVSGKKNGLEIRQSSPLVRLWDNLSPLESQSEKASLFVSRVEDFRGMMEFESPVTSGRTVTAVLADDPKLLPLLIANMSDQRFNSQIQGDLSVFDGAGMTSFSIGNTYWNGSLPVWMKIAYWFSQRPLLLSLGGLLIALILTGPLVLFMRRQSARRLGLDDDE